MPYKTFATNDVLTAADMNAITADAQTNTVGAGASESTTSTSYTDLTTSGPAVTISLVSGQQVLIMLQMRIQNNVGGAGNESRASFAATGSLSALTASDGRAILSQSERYVWATLFHWATAASTASTTITAKYSVSANTANYFNRTISVKKF